MKYQNDIVKTLIKIGGCAISALTVTYIKNKFGKNKVKEAKEIMKVKYEYDTKRMELRQKYNASNAESSPVEPIPDNTPWQAMTYNDMISQSYEVDSGWIIEGIAAKGLINFCVAGGDVGKSIHLVDVACTVAEGGKMKLLPDTCEKVEKQAVLYYRLENYQGEYRKKYGKDCKTITNSTIMWQTRAEIEDMVSLLRDIESYVMKACRQDTLICIDPITKLSDFDAEKFIAGAERIQAIAREKNIMLTFLVAAHTEEINNWKPLTSVEIKGGDKLYQQAGSVYTIRKERRGYRYFQSLKSPKGSADSGKVVVAKFAKKDDGFTYMEYVEELKETEALPMKPKPEDVADSVPKAPKTDKRRKVTPEKRQEILYNIAKGTNLTRIAKVVGVSRKTVSQIANEGKQRKKDKQQLKHPRK